MLGPDENKEEAVAPEKLDIAARAVTYEKVLKFIITQIGVGASEAGPSANIGVVGALLGSHLGGHFWRGVLPEKPISRNPLSAGLCAFWEVNFEKRFRNIQLRLHFDKRTR